LGKKNIKTILKNRKRYKVHYIKLFFCSISNSKKCMINVQKLEKMSLVSSFFSYLNCFIKKKPSLCFFAKIVEETDVVLKFNERVTFIPYTLFA
jgi:hypothetical protein